MPVERLTAASEEPTSEDERLLAILADLVSEQNKSLVDVAQKMLTITFTGIGVVLAIQEKWLGGSAQSNLAEGLVLAALAALLSSVPVYLSVIRVKNLLVTRNDYSLIEDELIRLAQTRRHIVNLGMLLTGVAVALLIVATTQ